VQKVWGVDLAKFVFLVSCDIDPTIDVPEKPLSHLVGLIIYGSFKQMSEEFLQKLRELGA
jgi:hypothetical protein